MTISHLRNAIAATERLTSCELKVLNLVAEGNTNGEAAEILFISKRTVDFHLSRIFSKLGVNNRIRAIREARNRGLLDFDSAGR